MEIESKLEALGLVLPAPLVLPAGVTLPFPWVRVHGGRAYVSGHAAQNEDGSLAKPLGKVGLDVSLEQARHSASHRTLDSRQPQRERVTWIGYRLGFGYLAWSIQRPVSGSSRPSSMV
jgi:hypothetical protein